MDQDQEIGKEEHVTDEWSDQKRVLHNLGWKFPNNVEPEKYEQVDEDLRKILKEIKACKVPSSRIRNEEDLKEILEIRGCYSDYKQHLESHVNEGARDEPLTHVQATDTSNIYTPLNDGTDQEEQKKMGCCIIL